MESVRSGSSSSTSAWLRRRYAGAMRARKFSADIVDIPPGDQFGLDIANEADKFGDPVLQGGAGHEKHVISRIDETGAVLAPLAPGVLIRCSSSAMNSPGAGISRVRAPSQVPHHRYR